MILIKPFPRKSS